MLPLSNAIPYPIQTPNRLQGFDLSGSPFAARLPRQPFHMSYQPSGDGLSSHYGLQQPRHGLPLHISEAQTTNYTTTEIPQWNSICPTSRSLYSNYGFGSEAPSNYQSAAEPYMPSSGLAYQTGATETASGFPGLSPLVASLPSRTLPDPTSMQSSLQGSCSSIQETECGLENFPQHLPSRSSISSATRDAINASEGSSSTASSSPSDTQRGLSAAYGNLAFSSHIGSDASASSLPSGNLSRQMSDENYGSTNSRIHTAHSGGGYVSNLDSSYNMQSLQENFASQSDPVNTMSSAESTSCGPLPPTMHHPQPQHSESQDRPPILRGSFDTRLEVSQSRANSKSKGQKVVGKR